MELKSKFKYFQNQMMNGSILKLAKIFVIFCLVLMSKDVFATHIVGGEITYRCLGNNRYEIILTVYRDCYYGDPLAGFDDPAWIGFYRSVDNLPVATVGVNGVVSVPYDATDTLDGQITSECNVVGQDVCVHRAVYRTIVTLPFLNGGYTMVYQRCCRNVTLQNIVEPLNTGAVFSVSLTSEALLACNSSPSYDDWPPIYICANKPIDYDHSATDADGDLLVYRLCEPYESGDTSEGRIFPPPPPPFDVVTWAPGYSLNNLLGGTQPLQINSNTGLITGVPQTIGQFLVGVCVDEFRNGVLLSRVRRDFQYNVRDCTNPTNACFDIADTLCNTTTVAFENCSSGALTYSWTFYDANEQVFTTSSEFEPVINYPAYGTYKVQLIVQEDVNCLDTIVDFISISATAINADFTLSVPECGNNIVIKTANTSSGASFYDWFVSFGGTTIATSNETNPEFSVDEEGNYIVALIVHHLNGCTDTLIRNIEVEKLADEIVPDSYSLCLTESVSLNPNGNPDLIYTWSPGTYLTPSPNVPNPTSTPLSDIVYFVDIFDPNSQCTFKDTVTVTLRQEPNLDFSYTNDCGVLLVNFQNLTNPPEEYEWNFGDNTTSTEVNPSHTYSQPGTYLVTLTNTTGCERVDTLSVTVNFIDLDAISDSLFLCGTNTVDLNPNGDPTLNYEWQPADKINGPNTVANPSATVSEYTVFTATVSDPVYSECTVTARVAVDVANIHLDGAGAFVCEDEQIDLSFTVDGNHPINTIVWSPDDERLISGQGTQTITIVGIEDETYSVSVSFDNGCDVSGTIPVDVSTFGGVVDVTISADTIFDVETVQLNAVPPGLNYEWNPKEGLNDPFISNPVFTPPAPGDYTFTVTFTNADNCVKTDQVELHVREAVCNGDHIFLPNAFSPNGDSKNDLLMLHHDGVVDKLNLLILYNRFGQPIFETTNINFQWNGVYEGKPLDPDVYGFYMDILCIDGNEYKLKGNITLLK